MGPSDHLCPRCGGREYVEVSANERRCVDCGLGSTFARLTAVSDPSRRPAEMQAGIDRLLAMQGQLQQRFIDADFSPFALDDRWIGLRSIGGGGGSNGGTDRLSLAHGYPMDPEAVLARVETRRPRPIGLGGPPNPDLERFLAARELVQQLVHTTGNLADDVRAAAFPLGDPAPVPGDPTAPWADATLPVDGTAVTFRVLSDGDAWVALGEHDGLFISIASQKWPLTDTGLVSVTDFRIYQDGSREITERARRDHQSPD